MPWRNLLDDASRHHFVGDFAPRPLADGPSGFLGILTGQRRHLAALFHRDLGLLPRSWGVLQALADAQCVQVDPLQADPAITPQAHGVHIDRQLAGNLRIGLSLRCGQDDPCSLRHLLFAAIAPADPC